jgi:hypothetical protein
VVERYGVDAAGSDSELVVQRSGLIRRVEPGQVEIALKRRMK